jgi:acetyltransferase-like isoleucine patch superfamily enzyme
MPGRLSRRAAAGVHDVYGHAWRWRMRRRVGASRFGAFGRDSTIVPPAKVVSPHRIFIGNEVLIHEGVWLSVVEQYRGQDFTPRLTIGDRTVLGRDTYISCVGEVEIGPDVLAGDRVLIADTYHDYRDVGTPISQQPMADPEPVRIERGVLLNVNVCILPGVTVGEGSYIGAGAVVVHDVPAHSVVVGNPGRVIRHWDPAAGEWREGEPD